MKDTAAELKPGKGARVPLTEGVLEMLDRAVKDIRDVWEAASTPEEFFENLADEWGTGASNEKFGKRTWAAFDVRGEEFRVAVILTTKNGQPALGLDIRTWWS
jgi:hypothetical protein